MYGVLQSLTIALFVLLCWNACAENDQQHATKLDIDTKAIVDEKLKQYIERESANREINKTSSYKTKEKPLGPIEFESMEQEHRKKLDEFSRVKQGPENLNNRKDFKFGFKQPLTTSQSR
jgi:hypothetical protein